MRTPYRRPGQYAQIPPDHQLTPAKFSALKKRLAAALALRPAAIAEMQKHAFDGDFSENAPYQIAKARLRGLNQKILELEETLKYAEIIDLQPPKDKISIGSSVDVEIDGQIKTYQILGSAETAPAAGIISYRSPLGAALLGHKPGDQISFPAGKRAMLCRVIKIN